MEENPKPKMETSDAGRAKVGEWIAGCDAVRSGLFNAFFIEVSEDRSGVMVDSENVDATELHIRDSFKELYPELFPPDEVVLHLGISHERRTSDVYAYPEVHSHSSYDE